MNIKISTNPGSELQYNLDSLCNGCFLCHQVSHIIWPSSSSVLCAKYLVLDLEIDIIVQGYCIM